MAMSIYNYAELNGIDCIVCKKSVVDLLGYSNGGFRKIKDLLDIYLIVSNYEIKKKKFIFDR